jgi:pimeloyl-ACP methyl ester carboxylesterase
MSKPIIHFAHGNSFPGGTYRQYLERLDTSFDVHMVDRFGHDPAYPVGDGWTGLVDQLVGEVEAHGQPVILLGHSLGGLLSMMAAYRRPELARCVVMLDSPVVAGWRALMWRFIKRHGLAGRVSPARLSAKRRFRWPDWSSARQHFAGKPVFDVWAAGVLDDYLEHGLEPHPQGGVQLRFSRDIETDIYNTLPHDLGRTIVQPCPVPIGFIAGTDSVELRQAGLAATRRVVGRNFMQIPGSHLFPMESPELTARLTRVMIEQLLKDGGRAG